MKLNKTNRSEELLVSYYKNSHMPVWIYDNNEELYFTNFTDPILLHIMDTITPIARRFRMEGSYTDFMKLYGTANEIYLCFFIAGDRKNLFTVVIGPAFLVYPTDEVWDQLSFGRHIWENQRDKCVEGIAVLTLESFLSNSRFIMQLLGIYHLDPTQLADTMPISNYFTSERQHLEDINDDITNDYYMIRQAYSLEEEVLYNIRKGFADKVDELVIERDRLRLLLPSDSLKENVTAGIALLGAARRSAVSGGMKMEESQALFRSYSGQLQVCRDNIEAYRLMHDALCAFAEGVQSVSVLFLDNYPDTIKNCIQVIHDHMPGKITLEELSEEVHLTPKYLSALFCKETGTSLSQFITSMRIDEAKQMLTNTEMSYLEISTALDYCSQSHFTSTFKKIVGITPKEYRLHHQKPGVVTEMLSDIIYASD